MVPRFSTLKDEIVDRGQHVVRGERRALISEEIDEHIWDGHKIWDPEFGGGPGLPLFASTSWNSMNLLKSVTASPVCHSHVFVIGRQIGVVLLWPFGPQ